MDIRAAANYSTSTIFVSQQPAVESVSQTQQQAVVLPIKTVVADRSPVSSQDNEQNANKGDDKNDRLTRKDVEDITDGLNDFMASMNTDIKFLLHQKMGELMVQVVDTKTHKVLRQSPPKELLDSIARIKEFVGLLLDKKI